MSPYRLLFGSLLRQRAPLTGVLLCLAGHWLGALALAHDYLRPL